MNETNTNGDPTVNRRSFIRSSAAVTVGSLTAAQMLGAKAHARGADSVRIGLIGCGGRGTGAARNALEASPRTQIVAMADVFPDRLEAARGQIASAGERGTVADARCHVGFDAYERLLADDEVDLVILATPPHFRPIHFDAAVKAGKHVFMEKPVAVDPTGIRTVLAAADAADAKGLCVVAGTQRRHEASYLAAMDKVESGAIGPIVAARCYWNMGGLWVKEQRPEWTDMEWQLRNWLYFTWLSGDHIVEQHVHNLDVVNWAMEAHPVKAQGMGGRQVRTEPKYGHIFDHFAIEYTYPDDRFLMSMCRQIDRTHGRVEEALHGTDGVCTTRPGHAVIEGAAPWRFTGDNPNPYVQEHRDLVAAIVEGPRLNEAHTVAESTLTAIMGRLAAYTGQEVTWDAMMSSTLDLSPPEYAFGPLPTPAVAMPGRTSLT